MVKQLLLVQERLPFCVKLEQGKCDVSQHIYLSQLPSFPYSLTPASGLSRNGGNVLRDVNSCLGPIASSAFMSRRIIQVQNRI